MQFKIKKGNYYTVIKMGEAILVPRFRVEDLIYALSSGNDALLKTYVIRMLKDADKTEFGVMGNEIVEDKSARLKMLDLLVDNMVDFNDIKKTVKMIRNFNR